MLLFLILLPNLEETNFGAQADKQPTQAKDYFKKRRQIYKDTRYPPEVCVQFEALILVEV